VCVCVKNTNKPHFTESLDVVYNPLRGVVHFLRRCETTDAKPTQTMLPVHDQLVPLYDTQSTTYAQKLMCN